MKRYCLTEHGKYQVREFFIGTLFIILGCIFVVTLLFALLFVLSVISNTPTGLPLYLDIYSMLATGIGFAILVIWFKRWLMRNIVEC